MNKKHNNKKLLSWNLYISTSWKKIFYTIFSFLVLSCIPIQCPPAWGWSPRLVLKQILQILKPILIQLWHRQTPYYSRLTIVTRSTIKLVEFSGFFVVSVDLRGVFSHTTSKTNLYSQQMMFCLHLARTEGSVLSRHSFIHWITRIRSSVAPEAPRQPTA